MKTLEQFCKDTIKELKRANNKKWSEIWVARRYQLQTDYLKGKVLSTSQGINIFENILESLKFTEEEGEYGENFRKLVREEIQGKFI